MKINDGELEIVNDTIYYCPNFSVQKLRKVVINNELGYLTEQDLESISKGYGMGYSSSEFLMSIKSEVYDTFEKARLALREYKIKSVQEEIKSKLDYLIKDLSAIDLLKEEIK
jgi:hypothetical protein